MSDADRTTWWDLADRLGVVRRMILPIDPRMPWLAFDTDYVRHSAERWAHITRRGLGHVAGLLDSMLVLSRGPVPVFPRLPEAFTNTCEFGKAGDCQRVLRADASHRFEQGRHWKCVERIATMVGLARHCLRQDDTMWVLKGAGCLRLACQAIRVFDAAVRRTPHERAALRSALVKIEELDRSPWPVLLGAAVDARATFAEHAWQAETLAGIVRQELRATIGGIDEMGA
jgi:hypothetical protein